MAVHISVSLTPVTHRDRPCAAFIRIPAFGRGNTLIQPQCSADSQLFHAKQSEHPNPMPTSGSGPPSLRPVTYRDGRCVGFKTLLRKIYHEARILAR